MTEVHAHAALRHRVGLLALAASVWVVVAWTVGGPTTQDLVVLLVGAAVLVVGLAVLGLTARTASWARAVRAVAPVSDGGPGHLPAGDHPAPAAPLLPGTVRARAPGRSVRRPRTP
ncbi:hypothetical protein CLV28_1324 [Sediminihabitans luteus]|uniref:Uncharacterized protein n=1 Tax=Sediminihabitans luteus TaxID=1138585 RepID=A0A2M9CPL8_9CELL|nr:hypothetical protein [Sediminihabitans luteus]PJJ73842.1 hypothetical protein CLV28_1324 [Sediminihabitans luteus]GII98248.1 hypothetical protein Slu03_06260 [Sediminihabitans luteus]